MSEFDLDSRKYLALDFDMPARRDLEALQRYLGGLARERGVKITLVPSLFLQVIVEDLGKLQDEVTEVVSMVAQRALLHQSAFTLKLSGLRRIETPMGAFLVVGVLDNARRLTLLRADLHRALLDYGFTLDERPYWPHVVIAQIGDDFPDVSDLSYSFNNLRILSLALYQPRPVMPVPERPLGDLPGPKFRPRWRMELQRFSDLASASEENAIDEAETRAIEEALDLRLASVPRTALLPPTSRRVARRVAELEARILEREEDEALDDSVDDDEDELENDGFEALDETPEVSAPPEKSERSPSRRRRRGGRRESRGENEVSVQNEGGASAPSQNRSQRV